MSGRARHLRDGSWITNRKTDRRNPRRDPATRRQEIILAGFDPTSTSPQVGMCFPLPQSIEPFIAPGKHGIGVEVIRGGYVRIKGVSCDHCCSLARDFLGAVARDRPGFVTQASVISSTEPGKSYGRYLTVTRGSVVVSAGLVEPKLFEAA